MERLKGKVAIVTGGATGIGKAIAARLAQDGAKVVVADLQKAANGALNLQVDVSREDQVNAMATQTMSALGRIDILVNNAAIFSTLELRPFETIPVEEFRKVMEVNVLGVWLCCRACAPHMRKGGYGRVINLASGAPIKGVPLFLHYISSKGAVIAMTRG
ncbi:MAG: SDR family NAD(P)-dependent oxidoreductase, partial [Burkholderiales bacterium]